MNGLCTPIRALVFNKASKINRNLTKNDAIKIAQQVRTEAKKLFETTDVGEREELFRQLKVYIRRATGWSLEDIETVSLESFKVEESGKTPKKSAIRVESLIQHYFGESIVKLLMKSEFNTEIIKNFFIDLDNLVEPSKPTDGTKKLLQYKTNILKDVISYYNKEHPSNPLKIQTLYDGENINNIDKTLIETLTTYFSPRNASELDALLGRSSDGSKEFVDAYKKWFIYKNFDELVLSEFEGVIEIAENLVGKDTNNLNKYQIYGNTDRTAIGWGDKDKTPDEVMNTVLVKLLQTFKKYDNHTEHIKPGSYLSNVDLNNAISTIKQVIYSDKARSIFLKDIMTEDMKDRYFDTLTLLGLLDNFNLRTLYELSDKIRLHGSNVYPIIFEIFSNKKNLVLLKERVNLQYTPWDSIYSLYKNLFEFGTTSKSLYNLSTKKLGVKSKEYYDMFVAQLDLTSPNNVTSVTHTKGLAEEKRMFASNLSKEFRMLQRGINSQLSTPMLDIGIKIEALDNGKYKVSLDGVFEAVYNPKAEKHIECLSDLKFNIDNQKDVYLHLTKFYNNILLGIDFNNNGFYEMIAEYLHIDTDKLANVNKYLLTITVPMAIKHVDLLNYEFTTNTELKKHLDKVYSTDEKPEINFPYSRHINFINEKDLTELDKLTEMYYTLENKMLSNVIMTGDGNMILALSITNGSTDVNVRWLNSSMKENSVVKGYSVFDWFIRHEKLRELNSPSVFKEGVKQTFNENMFTRFVLHFLEPRKYNETKVVYSTTSDKKDFGVKVFKFNFEPISKLGYKQTDKSKLIKELRDSYIATSNKVYNTLLLLKNFLDDLIIRNDPFILYLTSKYNINRNNLKIDPYFDNLNKAENSRDLFLEIVLKYNETHPTDRIKVVNNVDYCTFKGKLYRNPLIDLLIDRFNNNYGYFKNRMTIKFLKDLLRNNFSIQLKNKFGTYNREAYKMLVNSVTEDGKSESWDNHGELVLFKYKSKTSNNWQFGDSSNIGLLDNPNYEIKCHPALEEFNELHHLLSLEYNNATLGSYAYCNAKGSIVDAVNIKREYDDNIEFNIRTQEVIDQLNEDLKNESFSKEEREIILRNIESLKKDLEDNIIRTYDIKKTLDSFIDTLEGVKMIDYVKRNVDQSATVNQHLLNAFDGISDTLKFAYFPDMKGKANTVFGLESSVNVHDGAIFEEAITHLLILNKSHRLENVSDKPLITGIDQESGSGWIIKCASYANTNETMQQSTFRLNMLKNMMQLPFGNYDITKDMYGNKIEYDPIYIKHISEKGEIIYSRITDIISEATPDNPEGTGMYKFGILRCNKNGVPVNDKVYFIPIKITTNWDLYLLFGGVNSYSLIDGELLLSEASLHNMVKAVNNVARFKNTVTEPEKINYITLLHVDLPLKKALINYAVPEGACKKGFLNSNVLQNYYLEGFINYVEQPVNLFGRQLDPSHVVDQAEVSLMTLVMSGLASSHSLKECELVYEALAQLSDLTNKQFLDALNNPDKTKFNDLIANLILKSLVKDTKDTMLRQLLLEEIVKYERTHEPITYERLKSITSLDDAGVFGYLTSLISSTLSSSSISQKFTGTLSVLNPSYNILKLYTGYINGKRTTNRKLSDFEKPELLIVRPETTNLIEFESTYKAKKGDDETDYITVDSYTNYNKLKDLLSQGYTIQLHWYKELDPNDRTYTPIRKIYKLDNNSNEVNVAYIEVKSTYDELKLKSLLKNGYLLKKILVFGLNLKSYNIIFDNIADLPNTYQLWDLKVVQEAYKYFNDPTRTKELKKEFHKKMWDILNKISDGYLDKVYVRDFSPLSDIQWKISEPKIDTKPYEKNTYLFTNGVITKKISYKNIEYNNNELIYNDDLEADLVISLGIELNKVHELLESNLNPEGKELEIWEELELRGFADKYYYEDGGISYVFNSHLSEPKYKEISINKNTVKIHNYQAILPSVHAKQLGLPKNASVLEILEDEHYFLRQNFNLLKKDVGPDNYSYALKRFNGEHIYITNQQLLLDQGYEPVAINYSIVKNGEKDHVYRVDRHENVILELFSDKDLVYRYGDDEIIVTSDEGLEWYLNNEHYDVVVKGNLDGFKNELYYEDIILNLVDWSNELVRVNDALNNNKSISGSGTKAIRKLIKATAERHNSFRKSLETLVARIPAQGMASFMTMDIVDFTEGLNNAYVNHMLIFLLGSDYDIDKATFLEYSLDKSGRFIAWSPYFRMDTFRDFLESCKLPLSVAKNTFEVENITDPSSDISSKRFESEVLNKLDKYKGILKEEINPKNKLKKYRINFTSENWKLLQELLSLNFDKKYSYSLSRLNNKYKKGDKLDPVYEKLISIYNKHHLYLSKLSKDRFEDACKNFIVHTSCLISKSPKNLLRSQEPTDEASRTLKNVADGTHIALYFRANPNLPGNEAAKPLELINTQTGKEGVGVAASIGVKTYNALLNYYEKEIKKIQSDPNKRTDAKYWSHIIKPITFLGKEFGLLASVDINTEKGFIPEEYREIIEQSQTEVDTRNTVSAWVSLAVDNAKELKLGELNANPDFMGMYLYAAYLGIPLEVVANIFTSKTASILVKYMMDNVYEDRVGLRNPETIINKLFSIPDFKDFKFNKSTNYEEYVEDDIEYLDPEMTINMPNQNTALAEINRKILDYNGRHPSNKRLSVDCEQKNGYYKFRATYRFEGDDKILEQLRSIKNGLEILLADSKSFTSTSSDLLLKRSLYEYVKELKIREEEIKTIFDDKIPVLKLYEVEREVLDKNKDGSLKKDASENPIMKKVSKTIENESIYKLIIRLYKGQQNLSLLRGWLALNQGLKNKPTEILNFLDKLGSSLDKKANFDVDKYLSDDRERERIADYFEKKSSQAFNIYAVINSLSHYKSYFDTVRIQHEALKLASTYKVIFEKGYEDLKKTIGFNLEDSTINQFLTELLRERTDKWLQSKGPMKLLVLEPVKGFNNISRLVSWNCKLGTDYGNYMFLRFMNEIVIPDLKFNSHRGIDKDLSDNEFIKNLVGTTLTNTLNKTPLEAYRLSINILPKNEEERIQLSKITESFREIASNTYKIGDREFSLGDLFWYYNLILHNTKTNQNSLTPIFTKIANEFNEIKSYYNMLGNTETTDYNKEKTYTFAPILTREQADAKDVGAFYEIDRTTHGYKLWKRKTNKEYRDDLKQNLETGLNIPIERLELLNSPKTFASEFGYTLNFSGKEIKSWFPRILIEGDGKNAKYFAIFNTTKTVTEKVGEKVKEITKTVELKYPIETKPILNLTTGKLEVEIDIDRLAAKVKSEKEGC